MLAFSALVAGSFSLGHLVANEVAPPALMAVRFVLAAVVMGAVSAVGPGLTRRDFVASWRYLVLGAMLAFYFVLMFEGLKTAKPISASAVFTLMPLMAAVAGYFVVAQVTTRRMALALFIAAFGALWVIFRGDLAALLAFDVGRGEVIFFIGIISHAIYTPMVKRLNRGENPMVFTFGTLLGGSVILLLFGARDLVATDWGALPSIVWVTLGYLVIFSTAASFVALQYAALRLPAAKVLAYTYLTPIWVILWEFAFGNGLPQPMMVLGVAATILALVMLLKDEAGGQTSR
jgi:drug/metabolite transporter (DMT)-like permease